MEKRCFEWFETWKIAIVVVIKLEAPNKQTPTQGPENIWDVCSYLLTQQVFKQPNFQRDRDNVGTQLHINLDG